MTDLSISQYANDAASTNETAQKTTTGTHNQQNQPSSQQDQNVVGAEILIEQLHKFYGDVKVLEDLDLHITAGEFVAIVGRSGCGRLWHTENGYSYWCGSFGKWRHFGKPLSV